MTHYVNDNWGIIHTLGQRHLNSKNLNLWILLLLWDLSEI